jgi:hypothetical protein
MKTQYVWIGLGAIAIGLVGAAGISFLRQPSDEVQIQTALDEAIKASREGKPGPVLDFVSRNLSIDGIEVINKSDIQKFIESNRPEVVVENKNPAISGSKARITSAVTVTFRILTASMPHKLANVEFNFEKEPSLNFGILPGSKWQLREINTKNSSTQELSN